jgi:hypothetical protein
MTGASSHGIAATAQHIDRGYSSGRSGIVAGLRALLRSLVPLLFAKADYS